MAQSRNEAILENMLGADNVLGEPQSRIEKLLMELLESGGGGGGGYVLKPATSSKLGGIKVGANLSITDDGTLSAEAGSGYTQEEIDAMMANIAALLIDNASRNILPNNAVNKTVGGITFVVNDDGTVTANGTATADVYYNIAKMPLAENLVLTGCPEGGTANTYFFYAQDTVTNDRLATDTGEGSDIVASSNDCNINICIRNGVAVNDLVFSPMIQNKDVSATGYVKHYSSNVQLDAAIAELKQFLIEYFNSHSSYSVSGGWTYRINSDNTFEAWYKATKQKFTITDGTGVLYRSALTSLALPAEIYESGTVDIKHATVNVAHSNYVVYGVIASFYETGINYHAISGGSRSENSNYMVTGYVFGSITE